MRKIIMILLIIAIILLLSDIFTRIWFWNNLNLKFDSSNFNNILTPLLTIVATVIYTLALFTTINQNKIIISQNLKPQYEREIETLLAKARETKIDGEITIDKMQLKIDASNYVSIINTTLIKLSQNNEFIEDWNKYRNGIYFKKSYFENREYYGKLLFLTEFTIGLNSIKFWYEEIKLLIQEINKSKLISEEKALFKKRIKKDLLNEYMAFIDFSDKHPSMIPPIPIIFELTDKIEFKLLSKTNFREYYDWFKEEFEE